MLTDVHGLPIGVEGMTRIGSTYAVNAKAAIVSRLFIHVLSMRIVLYLNNATFIIDCAYILAVHVRI